MACVAKVAEKVVCRAETTGQKSPQRQKNNPVKPGDYISKEACLAAEEKPTEAASA
jgi:hypothetical protein